jgi:hypothetical protein
MSSDVETPGTGRVMLTPTETYEQAYEGFRWQVPQSYNIDRESHAQ